jgi:hypothetical protein
MQNKKARSYSGGRNQPLQLMDKADGNKLAWD